MQLDGVSKNSRRTQGPVAPQKAARVRPRAKKQASAPSSTNAALLNWCPLPVGIFVISLLVPTTASFYIGELRLTLYRLVLLVYLVPNAVAVFSGTRRKPLLCDWMMLLFAVWPAIALLNRHNLTIALQSGGIHVVEALGSYLLARSCIRDERSFRGAALLITTIVIGLAVFTVPEALTGKHILRAIFGGSLTGGLERRMGLNRAFGSFDHPILYGVFCASALSLSWYTLWPNNRLTFSRLRKAGAVMVSTIMSVSGGPLTAMICQVVAIGYDRLTHKVSRRWLIFGIAFAVVWVVIDLMSNRTPIQVFFTYLTFSPSTAYNRLIIWQFGQRDVWRNPIFGIGFNPWSKPAWMHGNSMDNFWLVMAVRFGLPTFLGLAIAILYQLVRIGRRQTGNFQDDRCRKAWLFSMVGLIIAGSTVHFWNSLFAYFCFLVGAGTWMMEDRSGSSGDRRALRLAAERSISSREAV